METQQAPESQQQPYIDGMFVPGLTVYGSLPARLSLQKDRLTLTTAQGTQEKPEYTEVLNAGIGEIQKVSVILDEVRIFVNGKKYRFSVAPYSAPAIGVGGVAGVAVAAGMYKKSGASGFLEQLSAKGVRITRLGYGKLVIISIIATFVLIGVVAAIVFMTQGGQLD